MSALTPDETILGLLASQPQHGYQLLETFNQPDHLGNVWNLSTSQLYAVLKRLEREGWITGQQITSDTAPARTEYVITDAGARHLQAWLGEEHPSSSIRRVRVEFLSRMYVAQRLNLPAAPIIARQRESCKEAQARLLSGRHDDAAGIGWLATELANAQLEAVLKWIDQCEMTLSSLLHK